MAIQGKWKLNEASGATRVDLSGNGNNLTDIGGVAQGTGQNGGANLAASFANNSSKYLKITDTAQTGLDGMSLFYSSVWIRPSTINTNKVIFSKWKADSEGTGYSLSYQLSVVNSNKISLVISTSGTTAAVNMMGTTSIVAGTVYNIQVECNGTNAILWMGEKGGTLTQEASTPFRGTIANSTADFVVGRATGPDSPLNPFSGEIDDLIIANHAPDAAERDANFTAGDDFPSPVELAGDLACVATLTGALTVSMNIAGSPAAVCTLTGVLTTSIRLAVALASQSTLTGNLIVSGWSCALTGQATMTGDLTTSINLLAALVSNATLSGSLQVGEVTEDIDWLLQDSNGLITGASGSTSLKILRRTPSALLDWSDLIFKASGWTSASTTLGEVDAVNQPGLYRKNVEIGSWIDGKYYLLLDYSGTPGQHIGVEFTIKAGKTSDDYTIVTVDALPTLSEIEGSAVLAKQAKLDFLQKWVLNRLVESADGTSVTLYDDDGVTPLKTWAYNATTKTRSKAV